MLIVGLCSYFEGIEVLYEWMMQNWEKFVEKFFFVLFMFGIMVIIFMFSFMKKEQFVKVEQFFVDKSINGFDQFFVQSLDVICFKIFWVECDCEDVVVWVKENMKSL